ncbi:MAG: hypothetical protein EOP06_03985 [Proteobacteria bacterium]|nr:MAG: hypothetical protein EOP06_03985 [Pseudomonadota bacterium]
MVFSSVRVGLVLVSGVLATVASAQDFFMPGTSPLDYANTTSSLMNTHINNITLDNMTKGGGKRGGSKGRKVTMSPLRVAVAPASTFQGVRLSGPAPTALNYQPNAKVRAAAKQAFVARITKINPSVGPQMKKAVADFDFFAAYPQALGEEGYRQNNVADAMASCLVVTWVASKGKLIDPDNAGQKVIRSRIATALLADPRMKNAAFRQQLGDELQMMTVFVLSGLMGAEKSGQGPQYGQAMAGLFQGMVNADPKTIALTSKGFVKA